MKHREMMIIVALIIAFIVVVGSSALQTVAGSLYAPPPSPPPPPTGPLPPRAPTFDVSQLKPPPPPPTIVLDLSKIPTLPRPNPVTPAPEWATYRSPQYGFSFQYPANWYVEEGAITNYDSRNLETKGLPTPDELRILFGRREELTKYGTLDNWVAQQKQQYDSAIFNGVPEFSYSSVEHLTLNNVPAIRWTVKGYMTPEGIIQVALANGGWLFFFDAYPATSKYIPVFDRIVASFRIP